MTRAEYITQLEEARIDSIENRWKLLLEDGSSEEASDCKFCRLHTGLSLSGSRREYISACAICPFQGCDLYTAWAETDPNSPEAYAAAQAIINFLESLDVRTWADRLVERGILERS